MACRLLILSLLLTTPGAFAAVAFPDRVVLNDRQLERVGSGTARYAGFIRVYDAALYAAFANDSTHILDSAIPKRLEIVYHKALSAGLLTEAALRTLQRQHGSAVVKRWQPQIERLHAAYRNVVPGDRAALVMSPARGLWLEYNGQEIAHIEDLEFARLYFGIWLGEQPLSTALRDALLPAACCSVE